MSFIMKTDISLVIFILAHVNNTIQGSGKLQKFNIKTIIITEANNCQYIK